MNQFRGVLASGWIIHYNMYLVVNYYCVGMFYPMKEKYMKILLICLCFSLFNCIVDKKDIEECEQHCKVNDGFKKIDTFADTCYCGNGARF